MGTFLGHILPGLALAFLGFWHTFSTIRAYYKTCPLSFSARFWYPLNTSRLKLAELVFIFLFSILAIVMQIFDYPFFHLAFKLDNFEHATIFLHLAVFSGFALCAEVTSLSEPVSGMVGILVTSVFGQEFFLLHFHSTDHVGLEGHYHWILQLIVFISFVAALACTLLPNSFPAAIVLSTSVVLQGCWFTIMGFILWVPDLVPQGCTVDLSDGDSIHGAVTCNTHEADLRARALANMQFSWCVSAVLIVTACICIRFAAKKSLRTRSAEYEQLQVRTIDNVQMATHVFKL
ncbi:hypothetical protein QQ045_028514 [Rhodiola kirilowii]